MNPPKKLQLKPEDLIRIKRRKAADESVKVDAENYLIAEFGYYFGYEGIRAIYNNEIDLQTVKVLTIGARKVAKSDLVDRAVTTRIALAAALSQNRGNAIMKKGLDDYIKGSKPDGS